MEFTLSDFAFLQPCWSSHTADISFGTCSYLQLRRRWPAGGQGLAESRLQRKSRRQTPRTYAKGIIYAPAGQMTQEQFGTSTVIYHKLLYNSRQQLAEILTSTTGGDTSWDRGKIVNGYSLQCSGAGCNAT